MAVTCRSMREAERIVRRAYPFSVSRVLGVTRRDEVHAWCQEQFQGECGTQFEPNGTGIEVDVAQTWCHLAARFWFKNPDHAFAFKMRWC